MEGDNALWDTIIYVALTSVVSVLFKTQFPVNRKKIHQSPSE